MTAIEFQGVSKSFHRNTGRLPLRNRVANWFRLERRDDGAPGAPDLCPSVRLRCYNP
jgi:hypothetical protein